MLFIRNTWGLGPGNHQLFLSVLGRIEVPIALDGGWRMKSNSKAGWAGGFLNFLKGPFTFSRIWHENPGAAVFTFNYQIPMPGFEG